MSWLALKDNHHYFLKKLEGNPGKRPLPTNEPRPLESLPSCPTFIKGAARREWNRITPQLYVLGLLTRIDRSALAAYCQAYGRWDEASRQIEKLGKVSHGRLKYLYRTSNDNLVMNPLLSVLNKAVEQMRQFLAEFGMTPASRVRIVIKDNGDQGPMDDLLSGNRNN